MTTDPATTDPATTDLRDARFEGRSPVPFTLDGRAYTAKPGNLLTGGDWVVTADDGGPGCTLSGGAEGVWTAVSDQDFPHTSADPAEAILLALGDAEQRASASRQA